MHLAAAARAGTIFQFENDLYPLQVLWQRAAPDAPLFLAGLTQRRICLFLFGLSLCDRLFKVFQRQSELVWI